MPDDELIDRLNETPGSGGDKLKEILDGKAGGEAGRLRDKLAKLWQAAVTPPADDSLQRMKARNTQIRLSKKLKPRDKDG